MTAWRNWTTSIAFKTRLTGTTTNRSNDLRVHTAWHVVTYFSQARQRSQSCQITSRSKRVTNTTLFPRLQEATVLMKIQPKIHAYRWSFQTCLTKERVWIKSRKSRVQLLVCPLSQEKWWVCKRSTWILIRWRRVARCLSLSLAKSKCWPNAITEFQSKFNL